MPHSEPLLTRRFVQGGGDVAVGVTVGVLFAGGLPALRSTTTSRRAAHLDEAGALSAEHPSP